MTTDKKPSGPFRAEDFKLEWGKRGKQGCAEAANALLAPLWEALERLEDDWSDAPVRDSGTSIAGVITALRALWDREEK